MIATATQMPKKRWPKERKQLADRLKALRDARGWSNAQLADFLGITPRAVHSCLYDVSTDIPGPVEKLLEHAEAGRI